jgi:hypothetical protein
VILVVERAADARLKVSAIVINQEQ